MSAKIRVSLGNIKVGTMDGNTSLNLSGVRSHGNNVCNHRNEGFGEQNADACITTHAVSYVEDSDFIEKSAIKTKQL